MSAPSYNAVANVAKEGARLTAEAASESGTVGATARLQTGAHIRRSVSRRRNSLRKLSHVWLALRIH
eukprot:7126297-Prymnesium_polylepis.2